MKTGDAADFNRNDYPSRKSADSFRTKQKETAQLFASIRIMPSYVNGIMISPVTDQ